MIATWIAIGFGFLILLRDFIRLYRLGGWAEIRAMLRGDIGPRGQAEIEALAAEAARKMREEKGSTADRVTE